MASALKDVVHTLLSCVCNALEEANRPVCNCFPVIGPPVVGICCECDDAGSTGDLTATFEDRYPADPTTLQRVPRAYPCRRGTEAADITLVLTRCYPTVDETGNMPSAEEQGDAADFMHDDIDVVWRALTCCPDIRLVWRGLAVDSMPEAGCSALIARVTVEV